MARITIEAFVMKQKGYELYLFTLSSSTLNSICYATPKTRETPDEVQRILNTKRAKEIGEYIKEATSVLPNAIVVSLTSDVEIRRTGVANKVTVEFPSDSGKYAYVLDGQHRLAGFKHSDGVEFELPVVALFSADENMRGKIFADINSKQIRVSDTHLLSTYYQIRELPPEQTATMDVVKALNVDTDSPLKGRIKFLDDEVGTWVTNKMMRQCLAPLTESGGALYGKPQAQQARILKEYLRGIEACWPDAWSNHSEYVLTRPLGIETIFGIFPSAKHRCDLNEGRQYTAAAFTRQLQPLKGFEVELPGGGKLPLDWMKGRFGTVSGAVGRSLIRKQLTNALSLADEVE